MNDIRLLRKVSAYVSGNPVSKVYPIGLLEWNININVGGAGGKNMAGSAISVSATSECTDGQQYTVNASVDSVSSSGCKCSM